MEAYLGKASHAASQHIPGPGGIEGMKGAARRSDGRADTVHGSHDEEKGQRLGELEEKTAGMMTSAEAFSKHAHEVSCLCKHRHLHPVITLNI